MGYVTRSQLHNHTESYKLCDWYFLIILVFKYTCIVGCFFSTDKRKYFSTDSVVLGIEKKANSMLIFDYTKKIVFVFVLVYVTVSTHLYTCPLSLFNLP